MKTCSSCKQAKPVAEFSKRAKSPDGLQPWCKLCNAIRSKRYYAENTEKHIGVVAIRAEKQRADFRAWMNEYKESHPCTDCGNYYPAVCMDFDHLRDKVMNVSRMVGYKKEAVMAEMDKCELVCANCHRIRTRDRRVSGVLVAL